MDGEFRREKICPGHGRVTPVFFANIITSGSGNNKPTTTNVKDVTMKELPENVADLYLRTPLSGGLTRDRSPRTTL